MGPILLIIQIGVEKYLKEIWKGWNKGMHQYRSRGGNITWFKVEFRANALDKIK